MIYSSRNVFNKVDIAKNVFDYFSPTEYNMYTYSSNPFQSETYWDELAEPECDINKSKQYKPKNRNNQIHFLLYRLY